MVVLHLKNNEESLFMFSTTISNSVADVLQDVVSIQNGRLQFFSLCYELQLLCQHGPCLPVEMQGLTDEQINELQLVDKWTLDNQIVTNAVQNKDVCRKRNGYQPSEKNKEIIEKSIKNAKEKIMGGQLSNREIISCDTIDEAFDILRGAIMISYPTNLPLYDPIRIVIDERSESCHDNSKEKFNNTDFELWFAGKKLISDKKLSEYFGNNEKSKVVVKLQKSGSGVPTREPLMTEEENRFLMVAEFNRRENLKKLMNDDESHLKNNWADPENLKKSFHKLNKIKYKPG